MSLATRCPACGTIFRVVQDQLKISEGWVRCGRCAEVFNASDALIDLQPTTAAGTEPGALSALPRARVETERRTAAAGSGGWSREDDEQPAHERLAEGASDFAPFEPSTPAPHGSKLLHTPSAAEGLDPHRGEDIDRRRDSDAQRGDEAGPSEARPSVVEAAAAAVFASTTSVRPPEPALAERTAAVANELRASVAPGAASTARSPRTGVRVVLVTASLALAALLVLQAGWVWRDILAAQQPALRPALQALCSLAGCRIEAPRRLDALAVQSSGLVQLDGSTNYRLDVVVRNRASFAARAPAVDLTLTDAQGRVVSRRVLQAAELGLANADPATAIPAGGELALQAVLSTRGVPVAGYTVELFYP
jgi:predicted Zn finger-like uncharacterized protein